MNEEFTKIFQLCEFILDVSQKRSLTWNTLSTLQRFLTWIPLGFIFETKLIPTLINKFFPDPHFRIVSLDCLTEIASLPSGDVPKSYQGVLQALIATFLGQLQPILPIDVNLKQAYEDSSDENQLFVQKLALFLGSFLQSYLWILDDSSTAQPVHAPVALLALRYMILVSTVADEEVFKTCLEFWFEFSKTLFDKTCQLQEQAGLSFGGFNASIISLNMYYQTLHDLRVVMIDHMAKPEEVIIVEDENGEIVREMTKDTEVIAQYNTMRDALGKSQPAARTEQ